MKKVGFIGLGTMGAPMTNNLLKAGYELSVYNRTSEKMERFINRNVNVLSSPSEVAKYCEVVFTMLTDDAAVEEVVLGEKGIIQSARKGLIVVDCSTVSPNTSRKLAQELAELNVDMLDAPVTGSKPQAIDGKLTFLVGGEQVIFERCQPLFQAMGKGSYLMGDSGAGSYTKLANNAISAINLLSVSEILVMVTKAGIEPDKFLEVISKGGARSGAAETRGPKMIKRDFKPNFKMILMQKDIGHAVNISNELGVPTPFLSLVRDILKIAVANGYQEEDVSSVVKCYENWAGIEVKRIGV